MQMRSKDRQIYIIAKKWLYTPPSFQFFIVHQHGVASSKQNPNDKDSHATWEKIHAINITRALPRARSNLIGEKWNIDYLTMYNKKWVHPFNLRGAKHGVFQTEIDLIEMMLLWDYFVFAATRKNELFSPEKHGVVYKGWEHWIVLLAGKHGSVLPARKDGLVFLAGKCNVVPPVSSSLRKPASSYFLSRGPCNCSHSKGT